VTYQGCREAVSARVVLPTPDDAEDDSEDDPEQEAIDWEDTDFLEDFPDDTEASASFWVDMSE
jgi:hypothetical protein